MLHPVLNKTAANLRLVYVMQPGLVSWSQKRPTQTPWLLTQLFPFFFKIFYQTEKKWKLKISLMTPNSANCIKTCNSRLT